MLIFARCAPIASFKFCGCVKSSSRTIGLVLSFDVYQAAISASSCVGDVLYCVNVPPISSVLATPSVKEGFANISSLKSFICISPGGSIPLYKVFYCIGVNASSVIIADLSSARSALPLETRQRCRF